MKPKIIYLFNSAIRPLYKENLLKILALPVGCITQFRYTSKCHVPKDLDIKSLDNSECIIVFVDRFSDSTYTYYPIRKGKIISTASGVGRIFLKCRLDEYCTVNDPVKFTAGLKNNLKGSPELTDKDPNNSNDGYYIQSGNDLNNDLIIDSESWEKTINQIMKTKSLSDNKSIFLKIFLENLHKNKSKIKFNCDGEAMLKAEAPYLINLLYFDPEQGKIKKQIVVDIKSPLVSNGPTRFNVGAQSDLLNITFETQKALQPTSSIVNLLIKDGEKEEFSADIRVRISSLNMLLGTVFYGVIISLLIFFENSLLISNTPWSIVLELMKWGIAFRIFYKLGNLSLPNLPLK